MRATATARNRLVATNTLGLVNMYRKAMMKNGRMFSRSFRWARRTRSTSGSLVTTLTPLGASSGLAKAYIWESDNELTWLISGLFNMYLPFWRVAACPSGWTWPTSSGPAPSTRRRTTGRWSDRWYRKSYSFCKNLRLDRAGAVGMFTFNWPKANETSMIQARWVLFCRLTILSVPYRRWCWLLLAAYRGYGALDNR